MTQARSTNPFIIYILQVALLLSVILAVFILVWGGINTSVFGTRLRISTPNNAVLIAVVTAYLYLRLKYGLSLSDQIRNVNIYLIQRDKALAIVLVGCAFIYLARIKLLQHFTFHTGAYDLAMYDTAIRNTLHGNFLLADQLGRNFFSEHFSPILLLIVPLYVIADTPVTALLVKALSVAFGLWFVYRIARHYTLSATAALLTSVLFLNYKYLAQGVMFDFHPEMMIPTFFLGCVYGLLKMRWWLYFLFLFLALSCKQDVVIYSFCLGLYAVCYRQYRYVGLATCFISFVWAIVAWTVIIPGAMPQDAAVSHFVSSRWGHLGEGYLDIPVALLQQPLYVASRIFSEAPIKMLSLLCFVPLLGLDILLICLPGLILNTTSTFDIQASLKLHYAAPFVPFVFWAFIVGLARLRHWASRTEILKKHSERTSTLGYVLLLLLTAATFGADYRFYAITPHVRSRYRVMQHLEPGTTVSSESGFIPHLSRHVRPYLFPAEANHIISYHDCDYILVDKKGNPWPLRRDELEPAIDEIIGQTNVFKIIASESGVYLIENLAKNLEVEP